VAADKSKNTNNVTVKIQQGTPLTLKFYEHNIEYGTNFTFEDSTHEEACIFFDSLTMLTGYLLRFFHF